MSHLISETLDMSMRTEIMQTVSSVKPFDSAEGAHIVFVQNWIASGVGIFRIAKPATPDPHLVSYFLLIDQVANKVLLVDHKKAGLWLPAGGHVELNEHPRDTVKRELQEELALEADFISDNPCFLTVSKTVGETAGHTDVSLWYILKGDSSQEIVFDTGEFYSVRWFWPQEIPYERSDPHMQRCIQKLYSLKLLG